MVMVNITISLEESLECRMRAVIPDRQCSKTIRQLIEKEVTAREQALYECAVAVEADEKLHQELEDWDITLGNELTDKSS